MSESNRRPAIVVALLCVVIATCGSARAEWQPNADDELQLRASRAVARFRDCCSRTDRFFEEAYGFAVFPAIRRLGLGIGGSWGPGVVVAQDRLVGTTRFRQFTTGPQIGVRIFSMIVFFRDEEALEYYKLGKWQFLGSTSISLGKLDATGDASYDGSVAIFTKTRGGLMVDAMISGAHYPFEPLESEPPD
jgi:lipid-binding SYLF domain-containing protein